MSMPSLDPDEPQPAGSGLPSPPESTRLTALPLSTPERVAADEPVPAEAVALDQPEPARDGWVLIALVPYDDREPPADVSDELAQAVWCAISALWHPSLLSHAALLPRIEPVESPSAMAAREIRVIASGTWDQLPSGYWTQAEDAGSALLESGTDRADLIRRIQERLGVDGVTETVEDEGMTNSASDFLAIGTMRWLLRDLSRAMGHADGLDHESLTRELLAGAHAWRIGDWSSAVNRLRAAFEVLTQARERFYPSDAYLIDLCLIDPAMPAGVLGDPLGKPIPISFIMPAQAIENQALHDPQGVAALRQAIIDGWADVAGGGYSEAEDSLLPLESILWQFRRGSEVYRLHLDERNVETYARRRFGLYPQLPQFARRFGFRYGLHMGFDAGRFPMCSETKRLWESPDGSSLESLVRPPMAADRPSQGWLVPWRMAATMKNDHVAALPLLHWPKPVASWYLDLRRAAGYSPVLGRWTTLNDFFHLTDRPYETFRPEADRYHTPYLAQAVAKREAQPISRLAHHHRARARLEAARSIQALARAIACAGAGPVTEPDIPAGLPALEEIESLIETGRHDEAGLALDQVEPVWSRSLARGILGSSVPAAGGSPYPNRPGYLVINPLNVPRRAAVILPDAALDLRPEGPLRAAQFTDEGVYAVVDLPAFGFAWVPSEAAGGTSQAVAGGLSARGHKLRNESIEIEIDVTTGGIRSVAAVGESMARLGQQLVVLGLADAQGKPLASQMRCGRFDVEYGGPALVQATSSGTLVDPREGNRLASFAQRYRLWAGRPILEIEVTLSDLDQTWLERAAQADPWSVYLACRWAWPDPNSMLRRTTFWTPGLTEDDRPETPDVLDISTRNQRTALLFGGLPYHRKHGTRMLDTLLVAGSEVGRSFSLGVVLDLEYPFHAAQDGITPATVVPVSDGPPAAGTTGWLAKIDHKGIAISHLEFAGTTGGDRGWGLVFHLLETNGQAGRCRLRLFRNPTSARQLDFLGETIIDLSIQDDAVLIDLTPHELARVEVTMAN
ncbi:MAG: glycosyl hydrolase family 38 [Isosphaerales bacterium]